MLRQVILLVLLTGIIQARKRTKPLAHLSGSLNAPHSYPANTEITDFQIEEPFRTFTFDSGRLIPQKTGTYLIYAQIFFANYSDAPLFHNHVALGISGTTFGYLQTGLGGQADYGSVQTSGLVQLYSDDYINVVTVYDSNVLMKPAHTFFGAFKVSDVPGLTRRKQA